MTKNGCGRVGPKSRVNEVQFSDSLVGRCEKPPPRLVCEVKNLAEFSVEASDSIRHARANGVKKEEQIITWIKSPHDYVSLNRDGAMKR